jgi:hypothetical protein
MVTVPATFAPLLGGPVGGFVTTFVSWRWIFLINLPLGVIGTVLALRHISEDRDTIRRPLDQLGFWLTSSAIAAGVLGLELVGRPQGDRSAGLALLAAGLVLGVAAARHALRAAHPLLDLHLLRIPTYAASALGGAPYRIACGALPLVLPLTLQIGLGMSAFASGLMMLAIAAGSLGMKHAAAPILRRFGFRNVLLFNGVLSGLSLLAWVLIGPAIPVWAIVVLLLVSGFFRSLQFTAFMAITWADIPAERAGAATSLFGLLQQLSFSLGAAFGTLLLRVAALGRPPDSALGLADCRVAFAGIAIVALLDVLWFVGLGARAGAAVSGHAGGRID